MSLNHNDFTKMHAPDVPLPSWLNQANKGGNPMREELMGRPVEPARMTSFAQIEEGMRCQLCGINETITRLLAFADRLSGPVPEKAVQVGANAYPSPDTVEGRMHGLVRVAESARTELEDIVERLERIA